MDRIGWILAYGLEVLHKLFLCKPILFVIRNRDEVDLIALNVFFTTLFMGMLCLKMAL